MDDRHRSAESVTEAPLDLDQFRSRGISFNLAPQAQDLHIDRTIVDVRAAQPREIEQLITSQNTLWTTKNATSRSNSPLLIATRSPFGDLNVRKGMLRFHPAK